MSNTISVKHYTRTKPMTVRIPQERAKAVSFKKRAAYAGKIMLLAIFVVSTYVSTFYAGKLSEFDEQDWAWTLNGLEAEAKDTLDAGLRALHLKSGEMPITSYKAYKDGKGVSAYTECRKLKESKFYTAALEDCYTYGFL